MNIIWNRTVHLNILNKSIIYAKNWKTSLYKFGLIEIEICSKWKELETITFNYTFHANKINHPIKASLNTDIKKNYCHGFWTILSQQKLGLRQKEVLPHGCILLPSNSLLLSSSHFTRRKHSRQQHGRRKVCLPTQQGQGIMETNWPPLSWNSGECKVCTGTRRQYRCKKTVKTTASLDQTLGQTAGYQN